MPEFQAKKQHDRKYQTRKMVNIIESSARKERMSPRNMITSTINPAMLPARYCTHAYFK
jgi:hypothetical protein